MRFLQVHERREQSNPPTAVSVEHIEWFLARGTGTDLCMEGGAVIGVTESYAEILQALDHEVGVLRVHTST